MVGENQSVNVEQKSNVLVSFINNVQGLTSFTDYSGIAEDGHGNFQFELGLSKPDGEKEILIVRLAFSVVDANIQISLLTKSNKLQVNNTKFKYDKNWSIFEFAGVFAQHLNRVMRESQVETSKGKKYLYPLVRESAEMFYGRLFFDLRDLDFA